MMYLKEIRDWSTLVIGIVGGIVALRTYILNQRQRKLENSLKLIELFNKSVNEEDLSQWKKIFVTSSELDGVKYGYFRHDDGEEYAFDVLFSEGNCYDNGAIERISEQFNLIGYQYLSGSIDLKMIYFQLGQIMISVHDWLSSIKGHSNDKSFLDESFPFFDKMYNKVLKKIAKGQKDWPRKSLFHIE